MCLVRLISVDDFLGGFPHIWLVVFCMDLNQSKNFIRANWLVMGGGSSDNHTKVI